MCIDEVRARWEAVVKREIWARDVMRKNADKDIPFLLSEYDRLNVEITAERAKTAKYQTSELDGRLLELPCTVGSTVYEIGYNCEQCQMWRNARWKHDREREGFGYDGRYWEPAHCDSYNDPKENPYPLCLGVYGIIERLFTIEYYAKHIDDFGKTVFFTPKEAEVALAERNNEIHKRKVTTNA